VLTSAVKLPLASAVGPFVVDLLSFVEFACLCAKKYDESYGTDNIQASKMCDSWNMVASRSNNFLFPLHD